MGWFVRM